MQMKMKMTVAILTVLISPAALSVNLAEAKASKANVQEKPYEAPVYGSRICVPGVICTHVGYWSCDERNDPVFRPGCVWFELGKRDKWVSIEVEDQTGTPVHFQVRDNNAIGVIADGYGKTEAPIYLGGSMTITVLIWAGTWRTGEPSRPTSGVVRAIASTTESGAIIE